MSVRKCCRKRSFQFCGLFYIGETFHFSLESKSDLHTRSTFPPKVFSPSTMLLLQMFRLNKGIFGNKDFICKQCFYTKNQDRSQLMFLRLLPSHALIFFPGHSTASISPKMNTCSFIQLNCFNSKS